MSWLDVTTHRALLEAGLVGLIGGGVGVQVVLRRLSYYTMALTHATFPGVVAASLLGVDIFLGGGVFGLLVVAGILALRRARGQDLTVAVGVALSAGFALGVVLLSAQNGFSRDLTAYTVGDILSVSDRDLALTAAVGLVAMLVILAFGKELTFGAFDPGGFAAAGYPRTAVDLGVLVLVEATVVAAVPAVGTILAIALLVAPATTARLWTDRISVMTVLAVLLGAGSGVAGVLISSQVNVAAGGVIALISGAVFAVSFVVAPRGGVRTGRASRARRSPAPATADTP